MSGWGRGWLLLWLLAMAMAMAMAMPAWAQTEVMPGTCAPRVLAIEAARPGADPQLRPTLGWEPAQLPDVWTRRWPGYEGSVWYRIQWERSCAGQAEPLGLGVDGMSMAGELFINDDRLWSDASLVEPLSRSCN